MREEKEEDLLNSAFRDPIYYILKNNNSNSIVQFISKNPLSLKTEYSSKNFKEILDKGAKLSEKNGLLFIKDTIFS